MKDSAGHLEKRLAQQHLDYLKSDDYKIDRHNKLLEEVIGYLKNKYPNNLITVDSAVISINGENQEQIKQELEECFNIK